MRQIIFAAFALIISISVLAQEEDYGRGFNKHKLFTGGNIGASFGPYTLLNISPQLGYRFNRFVAAGIGFNFEYSNLREEYNGELYRRTQLGITGLNVFSRFYPVENLFIQGQPELNYIFGKQTFYQPVKKSWKLDDITVPSILIGGGFSIPAGHGNLVVTILYDAWQDGNTPYGKKPFYNFGYNVSL